jgi:hypothetical protein
MSLIKNTSGQFLYAVLINKNDGSAITVGATLDLAKDGNDAILADAVLTHRRNGLWEAALSQEDSNGEIIGYVWGGTNVVPQGGTIVTTEEDRQALSNLQSSIDLLLSRITETLFEGMTSLGQWLGLMAGKQTPDEVALEEIRATGVGDGTYMPGTDSLEAIRDRGDAAWTGGSSPLPPLNGDTTCAENPAKTTGPTTEPPVVVEPLVSLRRRRRKKTFAV